MDVQKMQGIIEAIEAEAKTPAPSHQNLARLTGMAWRELMNFLNELSAAVLPALTPAAPIAEPATEQPKASADQVIEQPAEAVKEPEAAPAA